MGRSSRCRSERMDQGENSHRSRTGSMSTGDGAARGDIAPRRFQLYDVMILMAALACAIVLLHGVDFFNRLPLTVTYCWDAVLELCDLKPWPFPGVTRAWLLKYLLVSVADEVSGLFFVLLVCFVPALFLIRLLRPRPPLRLVIRQPVFGVCTTLMLGTLVLVDLRYLFGINPSPLALFLTSSLVLGWIVLGLPPWKPEPSWVDRAGRTAGCGWIVASILWSLLVWLA